MAKRVSADTITEITSAPGFHTRDIDSKPPTAEQLTESIRKELADKVDAMRKAQSAGQPNTFGVTIARAEHDIQQFEQILKEVPTGFRLVPVRYARITKEENAKLMSEYKFKARPQFMKFLADNYAGDLKKLGICDAGIERMRGGLDPATEKGELYSLNIDHIVERAGSGNWGKTRDPDPDQPAAQPKLHPNHFGNFILLPEKIHEFKNMLNDLQHGSDLPPGQSKWILMMAPERNKDFSGFVCPPQDPAHRLAGLDLRSLDTFKKTEHGEFIVENALEAFAALKDMPGVRELVRGQIAEAKAADTTVAALAEKQAAATPPGALRKSFNDAVMKTPALKAEIETTIKPAVTDVTNYMTRLFNELSAKTETPKHRAAFWKFARFFRSEAVRNLQSDVEALPFEEASKLDKTFRELAPKITKICDRLDAEGKAQRARAEAEGVPDFRPSPKGDFPPKPARPDVRQDNIPPAQRKPQGKPQGNAAKPSAPKNGSKGKAQNNSRGKPAVEAQPLPRRKPKNRPQPPEGRPKRTFGRPGHYGTGSGRR